jgi:hypothetical protein
MGNHIDARYGKRKMLLDQPFPQFSHRGAAAGTNHALPKAYDSLTTVQTCAA